MPEKVISGSVASVEDKVYVVGNMPQNSNSPGQCVILSYDVPLDTWSLLLRTDQLVACHGQAMPWYGKLIVLNKKGASCHTYDPQKNGLAPYAYYTLPLQNNLQYRNAGIDYLPSPDPTASNENGNDG